MYSRCVFNFIKKQDVSSAFIQCPIRSNVHTLYTDIGINVFYMYLLWNIVGSFSSVFFLITYMMQKGKTKMFSCWLIAGVVVSRSFGPQSKNLHAYLIRYLMDTPLTFWSKTCRHLWKMLLNPKFSNCWFIAIPNLYGNEFAWRALRVALWIFAQVEKSLLLIQLKLDMSLLHTKRLGWQEDKVLSIFGKILTSRR